MSRRNSRPNDDDVDQATLITKGYTSSVPLYKLRPMLKTQEELHDEGMLNFQLPRKSCAQMAPEIERLQNRTKASENQHRWRVLKRILKRARVRNVTSEVIPRLQDLDRSDLIVPDGEISKRVYNQIFHSRDFDLYGRLMESIEQPPRKHQELRHLATKLNIEYTQKKKPEVVEVVEDEEDMLIERRKNIPTLKTEKWKIGTQEVYHAPVGFANNPGLTFNSLGLESFYSYDGTWKDGKMDGHGEYLFEDGCSYTGDFFNNRPHGKGIAKYPHGQVYEGQWRAGKYHGKGRYTTTDGVVYEGEFLLGKRHGQGHIAYPSGLSYEGEFFDGKPHGRGVMRSKLTGWGFDGSFEKGFIRGSGQIITPPPESKYVLYFWGQNKPNVSLPGLIREYLADLEDERLTNERIRNEAHAGLRGLQLKEYVTGIRTKLHTERAEEKKKKYQETVLKAKEEKTKLYEARIRALAGAEEPPPLKAHTEEDAKRDPKDDEGEDD